MGAAIGGAVTGTLGAVGASVQYNKLKKAVAQRKSYVTPQEIYDILSATEQRSQGDTQTRDFETNQLDRAFSDSLGTAELLGADANDLSYLFDNKMNNLLKIGQGFHASNMESFGQFLLAKNNLAEHKTAEWQSQQDILKDLIAGISKTQLAYTNMANNGFNNAISALSSNRTGNLYGDNSGGGGGNSGGGSGGFSNSDSTLNDEGLGH